MGSSPVTATSSSAPGAALADILQALRSFFARPEHPLADGDGLCVAFSGGPDSLALLLALTRWGPERRLRLAAAHLDHGLDAGSADRARQAQALADRLAVTCVVERRPVSAGPAGVEAAARAARYEFLEDVRAAAACRYVLTAHHLDDQAETVALRLALGSGLIGLGAILERRGTVLRPLLGIQRTTLAAAVAGTDLRPIADPTNLDTRVPRNRLRHSILPRLVRDTPDLAPRLAALAERAQSTRRVLDGELASWFGGTPAAPRLRLAPLRGAPETVQRYALGLLHRLSGRPQTPSRRSCSQLLAQLAAGRSLACDCGLGRRWLEDAQGLGIAGPAEPRTPSFTYTFQMPGQIHIQELGLALTVRRSALEPWMFHGSPWRAGLALSAAETLRVRNRRPGDRLRPLGAAGGRRLKDVLIDAGVPRAERDRLPLLCVDSQVVWVPGVTIDERCRLRADTAASEVWLAEVTAS